MRLQAMQLQLAAALNGCSTVANFLALGRTEQARQAIQNSKHALKSVRAHLQEPNHVPTDSVAGICEQLAEVETYVSRLEASLKK